jgi:hypothetical protein
MAINRTWSVRSGIAHVLAYCLALEVGELERFWRSIRTWNPRSINAAASLSEQRVSSLQCNRWSADAFSGVSSLPVLTPHETCCRYTTKFSTITTIDESQQAAPISCLRQP